MSDSKVRKTLALFSQIGITMLVPIFIMLGLGIWLDRCLGIHSIIVFLLLGVITGCRNCFILLMKFVKEL